MRHRVVNPSRFQMPHEPVTAEYDSRGKRARKTFTNAYAARRFWIAKDNEGKNPKIVKE